MNTAERFQQFFAGKDSVTIIRDFSAEDDNFVGTIRVVTSKGSVEFRVEIPDSFPFHSIRKSIGFFCLSGDGYRHLNADGSICIHPQQMTDWLGKLEEEFELFNAWIEKYFVKEEKDNRYEYPVVHLPRVAQRERLFYTDVGREFMSGEFGEFTFGRDRVLPSALRSQDNLFVTSISDTRLPWATSIHSLPAERGLWVFIEREPFMYRSKIAHTWKDLSRFLPQAFLKELMLRKALQTRLGGLGSTEFLFVLIGYHIPDSSNKEVHWLLARIPLVNIPVYGKLTEHGFFGEYSEQEVHWCYTNNSSYARLFGRGGFSPSITNKKVLIIGTGAIGSSLAKTLTRGGAMHITVIDAEHIEPGNMCRSEFSSSENYALKCLALIHQLFKISPFVEVDCRVVNNGCAIVLNKSLTPETISHNRELLNEFDWIFDCTADNELCYVLDVIAPRGTIMNFSISDMAKEFVCVTGRNIYKQKEGLFSQFHQAEASYYEGIGCWNPTFQASYFDINAGLQLALKNIDLKERKGLAQRTFYIKAEEGDGNFNMITYDC
jgi:hypothetical protein